jgi:uncharacterized protein (TIGR01244 family)
MLGDVNFGEVEMRLMTGFMLAALFCVSACADSPQPTPQLQVDLAEVVATGRVPVVDDLAAAGQPDETALKVFADNGFATVIDLRTPAEDRGMDEPAVVEKLGMRYVSMPIGSDDITYEKAAALDDLLAGIEGPVLLHCGSSNRVGALLALRASAEGADDETAIDVGKRAGLKSLEPVVRDALADK